VPNSILGDPEVFAVGSSFLTNGFRQVLSAKSCVRIYVKASENIVFV
jgi:hypothetical protein